MNMNFREGSYENWVSDSLVTSIPKVGEIKTICDIRIVDENSDHGGWMLCNGRVLLQSQYPELFLSIGTTFNTLGDDDLTEFRIMPTHNQASFGLQNFIFFNKSE